MTVQAHPAARTGLARTGRAGPGLAGTGALSRLAFRRDRIMLPAWVYLITVLVTTTAYALKKLYPTAAARAQLVVAGGGNPALRFLYGRLNGSSIGALTVWRYGVWAAIFGALMTIFIVVRHTRGDEEAGRLELVGSAAVGRQAPLTAALLTAATANVVIVLLACLWLVALKLPATARGARGLAIAVLGAAFVLRGVGDTGPAGLSWLSGASPLGWVELVRAFGSAGEYWWALAFPLAAGAALVVAAFTLAAWRDHSAGLLPDRPGRSAASGFLRGPFSLAWRLQAWLLAGWLAGYVAIFASLGAATKGVGEIFSTSAVLKRYFLRIGYQHTLIDAYLSAVMLLAGLGAAAFATSAVLRLRTDETGNLAEPVLATATGRIRWALSHMSVAVGGAGLLLAAAGLSAGLGYGILTGSVSTQVPQLLGAALARWPAALVLAALAAALFGLLPWEATAIAWGAVALVAFIALLGPSLQAPAALMDLSPFTQTPKLPGGPVAAVPLVWLCGVAVALAVAGLLGLRRRDVGDLGPSYRSYRGRIHDYLVDYLQLDQDASRH